MPRTLVLDSEAVSALAHARKGMAELLTAALREDHRVVIPSIVLAEVMTGAAADAAVWHVAGRVSVVSIGARAAARAGALRAAAAPGRRKPRDLTVDAVVAAVAIDRAPAVVITSDPGDFVLLLGEHDVKVSQI